MNAKRYPPALSRTSPGRRPPARAPLGVTSGACLSMIAAACAAPAGSAGDPPSPVGLDAPVATTGDVGTAPKALTTRVPIGVLGGAAQIPCWLVSGNEFIGGVRDIPADAWDVEGLTVTGQCFSYGTDYVLVYDESTGSYLTNTTATVVGSWISGFASSDGTFSAFLYGSYCGHTLDVTGYDAYFGYETKAWRYTVSCG